MLVAWIAAASVAAPAMAQGTELEQVVVTARKRDESLHDVPVAVNAFNAEEIEAAGILRPQDFIALTPNMTMVQTQNQGTSFIVVRGISQARNSEPSVAVLIDGVLHGEPVAVQPGAVRHRAASRCSRDRRARCMAATPSAAPSSSAPGSRATRSKARSWRAIDNGPGYRGRVSVGGPIGGSNT